MGTVTAEGGWHALGLGDLHAIAESIPHIVWVADPGGSTEYVNRLGTMYTGLPRDAIYGWGWLALVHPEDVDRARHGWEQATRTGTPFAMSYRLRRGDGEFLWHTSRALPVRGSDGEIVKWLGTADPVENPAGPHENAARIGRWPSPLHAMLERAQAVASELVDVGETGAPMASAAAMRGAPGPRATMTPSSSSQSTGDPERGAVRVAPRAAISVLGTFDMRVEGVALRTLSTGSRRLLVLLVLQDRAVARSAIAGTLWPNASDQRAGDSLRSALSRLDAPTRGVIRVESGGLSLAENVAVDLRDARASAQRLIQSGASPTDADLSVAAVSTFSLELLPGWYEDWVVDEAEDWHHLRVNALEALARHLTSTGDLALATGAARAAIRAEPLRESAHAGLIRVHLAEGNQSEALRVFDRYRALLLQELGLKPTTLLSDLLSGLRQS